MGAVNDIAHHHIGDGINDFGNNGENDKERAAPKGSQLQNIRIVDIQIGSQHSIEQQRPRRSQEITEPFF